MTEDFKAAFKRGKAAAEAAAASKASAGAKKQQERDAGMAAAEKWIKENVRSVFAEAERQMEGIISVSLPGAPGPTPLGWTDKITLGNPPKHRKLSVSAFAEGHVTVYIDDGEGLDFGSVYEAKADEVKGLLADMIEGIAKSG